MDSEQKKKRSLKYCCVCKGVYRGKVIDGRTVSLHRFPQNKTLRRVWVQRCRTVMPSFKLNNNRLLCSEHFEDYKGPTILHTIPSIFPTENGTKKNFPTSRLDENQQLPEPESESDEETYTATPIYMYHETESNHVAGPTYKPELRTSLDISLQLHDYCEGLVPEAELKRNNSSQTYTTCKSVATNTEDSIKTYCDSSTQTETECKDVGVQTNLPNLVYEDICESSDKMMFYTGIPDAHTFMALFDEMDDASEKTSSKGSAPSAEGGGRPRSLRLIDEFVMVLMRLRLGLLVEDLAYRFCISSTACGRVLNKWIDYLDSKLDFLIQWPSRDIINFNMPKVFKDKFPDCRVIIDCTEIRTETPSSTQYKSLMYSNYKSHMTWKSLVGISPSGHVTYVSDLWAGSTSDKQITKKSGLVDLCEAGDAIMVDKGFTISDLTTPKRIKLIIPPFKRANDKFTKKEVKNTRDIANCRIHVERQMERIKNFRIVQGIIPITMSKQASKVWKLCAKLSNLQPPLVPH